MRCKSCNTVLSKHILSMSKSDGSPEDMCSRCRNKASELFVYTQDHRHLFDDPDHLTPCPKTPIDFDDFIW